MTPSTDPEAGQAFTRASVERYLHAAAAEQARLESAIAEARARTEAARQAEEHLGSLDLGPEDRSARMSPRRPTAGSRSRWTPPSMRWRRTGWSEGGRP